MPCAASDFEQHAYTMGRFYEAEEVRFDGDDNDCDGTVDEGCSCRDGETRPCGSAIGECKRGIQSCVGGRWDDCAGEVKATEEICDDKDNDCDGTVDGPETLCGDDGVCIAGVCEFPPGGCECELGDSAELAEAAPVLLLLLCSALLIVRRRPGPGR